jgi:hypothetical protein
MKDILDYELKSRRDVDLNVLKSTCSIHSEIVNEIPS